ncbi:PREDICTED: premnaspirodiene oxygenase-like [Nicotiana attenuata]|nr:PREDICTED: premnaspirodiene oxygenase-like [Nicotiana attenuata]
MEIYSSTLSFVALLMFFPFLFVVVFDKWKKSKQQKLPPGPWRLPFIGSIHHLIRGRLPHQTLTKLAKKYGPIMYLKLGEVPTIVISSPSMTKQILRTHDLAFATRPVFTSINISSYNCKDIAFAPYGDIWRQMRKICVMELLTVKMVKSFSSIRKDELSRLLSSIRSVNGRSAVNLTQIVLRYTNSVICRSAFGKACKNQDELIKLLSEVLESVGGLVDVGDFFPSWKLLIDKISGAKSRFVKLHNKADAALEDIINEHIKNRSAAGSKGNGEFGGEDLVDVLLRIKDNGELQFPITNDHIKAVISDTFAGGTETSAATIIWALSEMMKNPKVMIKAQSEVRQVFKGNTSFDEKDLDKLPYLNMVIKEIFRLHPPGSLLFRECGEQTYIDGYTIPLKTRVLINLWAVGREPEIWHDPESFIPERFENSHIDFMGNHFELVPFGAGKRICPGIQFGLATIKYPLAQLLYHFNWVLPFGTSPEDLDMTEKNGLTAGKKKDLYLIAIDHKDNEIF